MVVTYRMKVEVPPDLVRAIREAPGVVNQELRQGVNDSVRRLRTAVQDQLRAVGLTGKGHLISAVEAQLARASGMQDLTGVVDMRRRGKSFHFIALPHEQGATILPVAPGKRAIKNAKNRGKPLPAWRGKWLVFPIRAFAEITHVETAGGWRALKRARREMVSERWVRVRSYRIRGRHYFRDAFRKTEPYIASRIREAGERGVHRAFGGR